MPDELIRRSSVESIGKYRPTSDQELVRLNHFNAELPFGEGVHFEPGNIYAVFAVNKNSPFARPGYDGRIVPAIGMSEVYRLEPEKPTWLGFREEEYQTTITLPDKAELNLHRIEFGKAVVDNVAREYEHLELNSKFRQGFGSFKTWRGNFITDEQGLLFRSEGNLSIKLGGARITQPDYFRISTGKILQIGPFHLGIVDLYSRNDQHGTSLTRR